MWLCSAQLVFHTVLWVSYSFLTIFFNLVGFFIFLIMLKVGAYWFLDRSPVAALLPPYRTRWTSWMAQVSCLKFQRIFFGVKSCTQHCSHSSKTACWSFRQIASWNSWSATAARRYFRWTAAPHYPYHCCSSTWCWSSWCRWTVSLLLDLKGQGSPKKGNMWNNDLWNRNTIHT